MLQFREIELKDKQWADSRLAESNFRGCEYSFGNNIMWKSIYDMHVCDRQDFYYLENKYGFMYPAGNGDIHALIEDTKRYCESQNKPFVFTSMNKASMEFLVEAYGDAVEVSTNRDLYDYVYTFEALSTLKGKKLHSKRNHLNRFQENNWSYETITDKNIDECVAMSLQWCRQNECAEDDDKKAEMCAANVGLKNYFDLQLKGGLLRVDGKIQAFSYGEPSASDTFVVHVEKAFTEYQGTYPAINYEMINHECEGYTYINREEDTGAENLRKAKLSYRPEFLEEKFAVKFKL